MAITLKIPMISLPEVDPEIIKKGRWGEGWLLLINDWPYHNNAVVLLMLDFLFYDNTTYQCVPSHAVVPGTISAKHS